MRFWGITGTNGKTTTTWITAAFIDAMPDRKCGYVTTVEVFDGAKRFYTGYTTPPLAQLKEIFAAMEANGCTDCVMEVSSHAIHQHRTGDTVFAGGAFTNLSEDHLDYHKTMEAYFDVKLDFARQIAAAYPAAPDAGRRELPPYVVCLDGGYGREMFNAVGNLAVNVIGATRGRDEDARPETRDANGRARTPAAPQPNFDLSRLQLVGDYNQSNVLVAAALAEAAGVSHDAIQSVIPTLKPRWGRLEEVEKKGGDGQWKARVFVDFAHTPDGLEKVLTAVRGEMEKEVGVMSSSSRKEELPHHSPTPTRNSNFLWVVFGAGGDRDPMKRPLMGEACAKLADRLVVTSDNPRSEDPMKIIDAILVGVRRITGDATSFTCEAKGDATFLSRENKGAATFFTCETKGDATFLSREKKAPTIYVEPDRAKAIAYALTNAAEGDVVVIAGKGHETTQEIKGVKYPFDDREVVRGFGC